MLEITRGSHYVPRRTIKRWSRDGKYVLAYRRLVSHEDVPEWDRYRIKGLARQADLYTTLENGEDVDDLEKWLTREYEEPGQDAIEKLLAKGRLTPLDWQRIAKFVALQQLRTPLHFVEMMRRLETQIPETLEKIVTEYEAKTAAMAMADDLTTAKEPPNFLAHALRVSIQRPSNPFDSATVRAEVSSPRAIWLATIRHHLTSNADVICTHRWRAIEPVGDAEWPLTDHPVLTLNFNDPNNYDFGGGWGNEGSEFILPVSPRVAVYTQVKRKNQTLAPSADQTRMLQRLMAERAFRWIIAASPFFGWPRSCRAWLTVRSSKQSAKPGNAGILTKQTPSASSRHANRGRRSR